MKNLSLLILATVFTAPTSLGAEIAAAPCQAEVQNIVQQIFQLGHPRGLDGIKVAFSDEGTSSTGKFHMYRFWFDVKEKGVKNVAQYEVGVYHSSKDGSCAIYQLHDLE